MKDVIATILAAGKGTRMKSDLPKPLVPVKGKPILKYITENLEDAGIKDIAIIIGYKGQMIKGSFEQKYIFVEQTMQNGTGHAVLQAKDKINWRGKNVIVFVGDSPLITGATIKELLEHHNATNADCTFLTADFQMDLPYARVIKDTNGNLIRCVEEKNASPEELLVTELLSSHFVFKGDVLFRFLEEIAPDPENGEIYLTDILDILLSKGYKVEPLHIDNYEELVGLNTPEDVAWAEDILTGRKNGKN